MFRDMQKKNGMKEKVEFSTMKFSLSLCLWAIVVSSIPSTTMATNSVLRSNHQQQHPQDHHEEINEVEGSVVTFAPENHHHYPEVVTMKWSSNNNNINNTNRGVERPRPMISGGQHDVIYVTSQTSFNSSSVVSRKMSDSPMTRIIGGGAVNVGEYPYFVDWGGCGGSLIAPDIVLTAAHCGGGLGDVIVGGVIKGSDNYGGIRRKVIGSARHPKFSEKTFHCDFLLLKLDKPVWSKQRVEPNFNRKIPYRNMNPNKKLTVIGVGDVNEKGDGSDRLREVGLQYMINQKCKTTLKQKKNDDGITWSMMCALHPPGGKDSCSGDSGGPILIKRDKKADLQVGIVSWGYGCAQPGVPGMYSRVAAAQEWIRDKTCSLTGVIKRNKPEYCQPSTTATKETKDSPSESSALTVRQGDVSSDPSSCGLVRLKFEADWRPNDNEFVLEDQQTGDYIWDEYKFDKFQVMHRAACIDRNGCHVFNFQDANGDGLRGRGKLTLQYEGTIVYEEDKNIGSGMTMFLGDGCDVPSQ